MYFGVRRSEHGRWSVLSVTGEIDLASLPRMRAELQRVSRDHGDLCIDLAECDLMDSMGLGLLVGAARRTRERGDEFCVLAPNEPVAGLLRRCRLDEIFVVSADTTPSDEP